MTDTAQVLTELTEIAQRIEQLSGLLESYKDVAEQQTPNEVAAFFFSLKNTYNSLDGARKRVYHVYEAFDKGIVPGRLEAFDIDMLRIPELGRSFGILHRLSASINKDRKEEAYGWLREQGAEELIQETVNAGTLASYVRGLMVEQGIEPPIELFTVTPYKTTGINKYTPKKAAK